MEGQRNKCSKEPWVLRKLSSYQKTDIKNLPIGPGIMPVISFFGKNKIMEKKNCLRHGRLLFEELTVGMNAH